MRTRRPARVLGAALLMLAALPGVAHAAAIAPLKPCYVSVNPTAREAVDVAGSGFPPNAVVDVSLDGALQRSVQADGAGNIPAQVLQAPFHARGQRSFTVTLVEQSNPANAVTATTNVTALNLGIQPRRSRPSRRVLFRGRGFTGPARVYAHYLFRGRVRKTVTLTPQAQGPCGTFAVRKRQIPVRSPRTGTWTLQVDQQRSYSRTPRSVFVRVAILVQRVFRLRPR
jgi:hypothetical protein